MRAPADRPLSALFAIVALVVSWALLAFLVHAASAAEHDRLSAHAEPEGVEARP